MIGKAKGEGGRKTKGGGRRSGVGGRRTRDGWMIRMKKGWMGAGRLLRLEEGRKGKKVR